MNDLVSIPSEFTLLSNINRCTFSYTTVSIPSEFTLLSNNKDFLAYASEFQYPLNLHCSQTVLDIKENGLCFNTL